MGTPLVATTPISAIVIAAICVVFFRVLSPEIELWLKEAVETDILGDDVTHGRIDGEAAGGRGGFENSVPKILIDLLELEKARGPPPVFEAQRSGGLDEFLVPELHFWQRGHLFGEVRHDA